MQEKIKCALKNTIITAINCNDSDNFCSVIGVSNTDEIREWWGHFCNPLIEFFNFACKSTNCNIYAFADYMSNETVEALETAIMETNGEDFIIQLYSDNDLAAHTIMVAVNMRFMKLNDLNIYKNELMGITDRIG